MFSLYVFHDENTVHQKTFRMCVREYQVFSAHHLSYILYLIYSIHYVDASLKSILSKYTFRPGWVLNLSLDDKLSSTIMAKLSRNSIGFSCIKCYISSWYWNQISMHKLGCLIFVQSHVSLLSRNQSQ